MLNNECYVKGLNDVKELSTKLEALQGKAAGELLEVLHRDGIIQEATAIKFLENGFTTLSVNYKTVGVTLFIDDNSCRIGGTVEVFGDGDYDSDDSLDVQTLEHYVSKLNVA